MRLANFRQGPLTIPSQQIPEEDDLASFDQIPHGHFETEPRPPTPPKELSDEDVKPSVVDLGPPTHGKFHKIERIVHENFPNIL